MKTIENYYPVSPNNVPAELTALNETYKQKVIVVLGSILLFLLTYFALLSFSAWSIWLAIIYPMKYVNTWTVILKLGLIGVSILFFIFLIKFLFDLTEAKNKEFTEIKESEQPLLFAFIRQICTEIGAPFPHKIYLSPEVNACVFYHSTFWSLFFPVKKNLLIGLGLINSLNISEFKAVLAHEFGHFSQKSMKLGSYIYVANQIIYNMVNQRDKWDDVVEQMKESDFRIAIFGWILHGIVWVVRKLMIGIYKIINLTFSSLSKQMEFNADNIAVSLAGSDAVVTTLYKVGFQDVIFNNTLADLQHVHEYGFHTNNIFVHQNETLNYIKEINNNPNLGNPPATGKDVMVFEEIKEDTSSMYASHPSDYERERNAKRIYIESTIDERLAWELFENKEALCKEITRKFYELRLPKKNLELQEPHVVINFLDSEREAYKIGNKYHNLFDYRFFHDFNPNEVIQSIDNYSSQENPFLNDEFKNRANEFIELRKKENEMFVLLNNNQQNATINYKDSKYTQNSFQELINEQRLLIDKANNEYWNHFDKLVFAYFYKLSSQKPDFQKEWVERFTFHNRLGKLKTEFSNLYKSLQDRLFHYSQISKPTEKDLSTLVQDLEIYRNNCIHLLKNHLNYSIPQLPNEKDGRLMNEILFGEEIRVLPYNVSLLNDWISYIFNHITSLSDELIKLDNKNFVCIIKLSEKIESEVVHVE
jgi:Zn-dependent protease with chaperone function